MGRTFNRPPAQFKTPSGNEIKNYYFNHYNWKGIDRNKNFLAVDQETFADAKNVYMDTEGLLSSRPCLTSSGIYVSSGMENEDLVSFGDFFVLTYRWSEEAGSYAGLYEVFILEKDFNGEPTLKYYELRLNKDKPKYLYRNDKIYIFAGIQFKYFNCIDKKFYDGGDQLYIPETKFTTASTITKIEDENIFTKSRKHVYLYNSVDGMYMNLLGKIITTEIDDREISFRVDEDSTYLLQSYKFTTDLRYLNNDKITIDVSVNNQILLYDLEEKELYYSDSGRVFRHLESLSGYDMADGDMPRFSKYGEYVVIPTMTDLWILSVISTDDDGTLRYPTPTSLSKLIDAIIVDDRTPGVPMNFDLIDETNFACAFATGQSGVDMKYIYYDGNGMHTQNERYLTSGGYAVSVKSVKINESRDFVSYIVHTSMQIRARAYLSNFGWDVRIFDPQDFLPAHHENAFRDYKVRGTSGFLLYGPINDDGIFFYKLIVINFSQTYGLELKRIETFFSGSGDPYAVLSNDCGKLATSDRLYDINLGEGDVYFSSGLPVAFTDHLYTVEIGSEELTFYSSKTDEPLNLIESIDGDRISFNFNHILDTPAGIYLASDKTLYVGEFRDEKGVLKLYAPTRSKQEFSKTITGLHQISQTEVAIFFDDEVFYARKTDLGYEYHKSKLTVGLKNGASIETSEDGATTYFVTDNGLVALSYQDFVASTEQALTYLTDTVRTDFKIFASNPVRVCRHSYWLFMSNIGLNHDLWVFDARNGSSWRWELPVKCLNIENFNNKIYLHGFFEESNHYKNQYCIYTFDDDSKVYKDQLLNNALNFNSEYYEKYVKNIDWYIKSQKLHLNASNFYKHISNITFSSVTKDEHEFSMDLYVTNYRDYTDEDGSKTIAYKVELIRTFVQRLNYMKVNEFQYLLKSDELVTNPARLKLSDVTIKYKITGQVR